MISFRGTVQQRRFPLVLCLFMSVAAFPVKSQSPSTAPFTPADRPASREVSARLASSYGKLPISFEPNKGQTDKAVQFVARGSGYVLFLEPDEAVMTLFTEAPTADGKKPSTRIGVRPREFSTIGLKLIGAEKSTTAEGEDQLPGFTNYLVGKDPSKWQTGVPTYAKVRYTNVYPRIDLVYYGNQEGVLEHDFVVKPGGDPDAISFALQNADNVTTTKAGGIMLQTKAGGLELQKPVAYQIVDGRRKTIPVQYEMASGGRVSFQVGAYDNRSPLVIDPVLRYTAAFGGSDGQGSQAAAIAVDSSMNTYIVGTTYSGSFPLDHPYQANCNCPGGFGVDGSGFISKVNAAGTAFVYSTYFGLPVDTYDPSGHETADDPFIAGVAVDSAQRVYFVGYDPSTVGNFVASLNAAGSALLYQVPLHGKVAAIALDAANNAYATGLADSNFPPVNSIASTGGTYVEKVSSTGVVEYATLFDNNDTNGAASPSAIAVDSTGAAYVTGDARNGTLPTTTGAYQKTCVNDCAFVAKISPSGSQLVYSTFLAGPSTGATPNSEGTAIQVDSQGEAYVAGFALTGFPVTANAFQKTGTTSIGGVNYNGFVTKLNAAGSGLMYSTLLNGGGNTDNRIWGMALDAHRTVYVTGTTTSTAFPQKAPIPQHCGGFLTTLNPTLSYLAYYSILMGGRTVAIDKALNAYVSGGVCPATYGELKVGLGDVTVTKIVIMDDVAAHISASPSPVSHGANLTYTLSATSNGPDFGYNVHIDDSLPSGTTFVSDTAGGGTCTAPAVGTTGKLHCTLGTLNKGQTFTVTLTVKVNAAAGSTLTNRVTVGSNMQDYTWSNNTATATTTVH